MMARGVARVASNASQKIALQTSTNQLLLERGWIQNSLRKADIMKAS